MNYKKNSNIISQILLFAFAASLIFPLSLVKAKSSECCESECCIQSNTDVIETEGCSSLSGLGCCNFEQSAESKSEKQVANLNQFKIELKSIIHFEIHSLPGNESQSVLIQHTPGSVVSPQKFSVLRI